MAYTPLATEIDTVYTLTSPDGIIAVFNDPASGNYAGYLTEVTGLDSPEVRESSQDLVESDGGAHGAFYFGRRPVVLNGRVVNHSSITVRNQRLDRARRASLALRGDSILKWTPTTAQEVYVALRRQQPFRESGGWNKEFQIPMVAETAVIRSTATVTVAGGVATENVGNYPAFPLLEITGVSSNPRIDVSPGTMTFRTTGLTLASGEKVVFNMLTHTGVFTAGARVGQSANQYINYATTIWPSLDGNGTTDTFTLFSGGGTLSVSFQHAWA